MLRIHFIFSAIFLSLILTACATSTQAKSPQKNAPINHSLPAVFEADFIPHNENKPFGSYLAMNLPFENFAPLRLEIEHRLQALLKHRGEAHITVITPPEFDQVLSSKIKIEEINQIARKLKIQRTSLEFLCIGKATKHVGERLESAYFVVVQAENLLKIRQEVAKLFVSRGGKAGAFKPELFFPHVTLGYTLRDLHYEEGALKDKTSCTYALIKGPS